MTSPAIMIARKIAIDTSLSIVVSSVAVTERLDRRTHVIRHDREEGKRFPINAPSCPGRGTHAAFDGGGQLARDSETDLESPVAPVKPWVLRHPEVACFADLDTTPNPEFEKVVDGCA